MSNIKDLSLSKALSALSLPELPKQYRDDCGEYWLEAIVLVRKQNLSNSYAVAKRGADGKIVYKADFGDGKIIDYEKLYNGRFILLRTAFERAKKSGVMESPEYSDFLNFLQ